MNYFSIVITGASSGIGKALALEYAKDNVALYLMGRNLEKLEEVSKLCTALGAIVQIEVVDICNREQMATQILSFDRMYPVDLVIANAGIGIGKNISKEPDSDPLDVIGTNILGLHATIEPLIVKMKERKKGQIAIMSSLASFRGFAKHYVYNGTKAYGRIYGQGLRLDLKRFGIKVSTIAPGFVKTPLTDKNNFYMPLLVPAEKAAHIIRKGLQNNKSLIAFPLTLYLILRFLVALPNYLADKIAESVF